MRRTLFYLSAALLVFLIVGLSACGRIETKIDSAKLSEKEFSNMTETKDVETCTTMDFHYLITEDSMATPTLRHIELFLDKRLFQKRILKRFLLISVGKILKTSY